MSCLLILNEATLKVCIVNCAQSMLLTTGRQSLLGSARQILAPLAVDTQARGLYCNTCITLKKYMAAAGFVLRFNAIFALQEAHVDNDQGFEGRHVLS